MDDSAANRRFFNAPTSPDVCSAASLGGWANPLPLSLVLWKTPYRAVAGNQRGGEERSTVGGSIRRRRSAAMKAAEIIEREGSCCGRRADLRGRRRGAGRYAGRQWRLPRRCATVRCAPCATARRWRARPSSRSASRAARPPRGRRRRGRRARRRADAPSTTPWPGCRSRSWCWSSPPPSSSANTSTPGQHLAAAAVHRPAPRPRSRRRPAAALRMLRGRQQPANA